MEQNFLIYYHDGPAKQMTGEYVTAQQAMDLADAGAHYPPNTYEVVDKNTGERYIRNWMYGKPDPEATNIIPFGEWGYYAPWIKLS